MFNTRTLKKSSPSEVSRNGQAPLSLPENLAVKNDSPFENAGFYKYRYWMCMRVCLYLAGVIFSIPDKDARMEVKIKKMSESQSELALNVEMT